MTSTSDGSEPKQEATVEVGVATAITPSLLSYKTEFIRYTYIEFSGPKKLTTKQLLAEVQRALQPPKPPKAPKPVKQSTYRRPETLADIERAVKAVLRPRSKAKMFTYEHDLMDALRRNKESLHNVAVKELLPKLLEVKAATMRKELKEVIDGFQEKYVKALARREEQLARQRERAAKKALNAAKEAV